MKKERLDMRGKERRRMNIAFMKSKSSFNQTLKGGQIVCKYNSALVEGNEIQTANDYKYDEKVNKLRSLGCTVLNDRSINESLSSLHLHFNAVCRLIINCSIRRFKQSGKHAIKIEFPFENMFMCPFYLETQRRANAEKNIIENSRSYEQNVLN